MEEPAALSRENRLLNWLCPGNLERGRLEVKKLSEKIQQVYRVRVGAENSQEVAQETITRLADKLDRNPEEISHIPPHEKEIYVLGIARNVQKELGRQSWKDARIVEQISRMETNKPYRLESPKLTVEDLMPHITPFMEKLQEKDRELVAWTSKLIKIAAKRGVSANSLYAKRHRLLKQLRGYLIEKGVLEVEDFRL